MADERTNRDRALYALSIADFFDANELRSTRAQRNALFGLAYALLDIADALRERRS